MLIICTGILLLYLSSWLLWTVKPVVNDCTFCSDLKRQDHINYVYNKLIKFTSIFYKIRNKLPQVVLKMIYFAFVHSHLLYGIEIYANTTSNHLSKLTVLNNKLLHILQYKSTRTHSYELYQTYFTLPVQLLHKYQILIFMHNYRYYRTKLLVHNNMFLAHLENKLSLSLQ